MNETRVRALVPVIIIVAVVGIGVYFWMQNQGSGSQLAPEQTPEITPELPTEKAPEKVGGVVVQDPGQSEQEPTSSAKPALTTEPQKGSSQKGSGTDFAVAKTEPDPKLSGPAENDDRLKAALSKAADSEDYTALGTALAEIYKKYPQGKKDFIEIESRAYVKATSYLDEEKNVTKAKAAADAVYSKHPFGWRFKYLRVRVLERLGRDAFAAGDLVAAEKHALTMLGMEFRPEGANLMADIYLKRIDDALAKGDMAAARAAYDEIKDYEVSSDRRATLNAYAQNLQ